MKKNKKIKKGIIKVFFAGLVGFINGFFGGGGGLVCVPTLEKVYGLDTKKSHATAVSIMLPLSLASSVVYVVNNNLNWIYTLLISLGVLLGGLLGAYALKKFRASFVRWIFIVVLFVAGVRMII